MRYFKNTLRSMLLIVAASLLMFTACSEDDVNTPVSGHFEAEGVRLKTSGITVAEIFQGVTSDTLHAVTGSLTDHFAVYFLDASKGQLNPPVDADKTFKAVIDDNSVVEFWQHPGKEGGYEFHLRGLKAGTTFIEFFIEHAGHNDYRSGKMPVTVAVDTTAEDTPHIIKLVDEESGVVLAEAHDEDENSVTGQLQINAGDTSDHIEVQFFDESLRRIYPSDAHASILIASGDENLLGIEEPSAVEPFAFKLIGKLTGNTNITVSFRIDGEGKRVFTPIPVKVNP